MNSLEYIFNSRINNEISKGPNIKPMKPKSFSPMITPKIVVNGCTLPIFFSSVKRNTLSTVPIMPKPNNVIAIPCQVWSLAKKIMANGT